MKKLIILLFLAAAFVQCEDALQETPRSFLSKENFYQTEDDALSALFAVYGILDGNLGGEFFPTVWFMSLLECRADYCDGRGSQQTISIYDQPLDGTNQGRAFGCYNEIYRGINRANAVLENVPGIDMDASLRDQIVAEAKFLRAYYYSSLVKYWGGVPIRDKEFTSIDQIGAPRATAAAVWDFIIKDLTEAIPDLAESFSAGESGRATSWAAKILLADSYLNIEKWAEARDLADDVIKNGSFSLIEVKAADDFLKIYGPLVDTHAEDIWSIHYSATNGQRVTQFLHRTVPNGYGVGGVYAYLPVARSFVGPSWDTKDLRQQFNLYSYVVQPSGDTIFLPAPSPLFKKYQDGNAPDRNLHRNNIPVFRLAEAYLVYAEADCMATGTTDGLALERLNIIRRRAYGLDPYTTATVDYPAGFTREQFRDLVIKERGYEFILEMKRWNDLLRTGKAKATIEATGKAWKDVSYLFPIPLDEINNNPAMSAADQNPGY